MPQRSGSNPSASLVAGLALLNASLAAGMSADAAAHALRVAVNSGDAAAAASGSEWLAAAGSDTQTEGDSGGGSPISGEPMAASAGQAQKHGSDEPQPQPAMATAQEENGRSGIANGTWWHHLQVPVHSAWLVLARCCDMQHFSLRHMFATMHSLNLGESVYLCAMHAYVYIRITDAGGICTVALEEAHMQKTAHCAEQVACGLAGMQASPNARGPSNGGGGGPARSPDDASRSSGLTHSGDTTHSDLSGACILCCAMQMLTTELCTLCRLELAACLCSVRSRDAKQQQPRCMRCMPARGRAK